MGAVVKTIRGDSGFDSGKVFVFLEAGGLQYAISARFMRGVKREVQAKKTLGIIRTMVLACGAELGRDGHKTVLRLSLAGKRKEQFRGYCDRIFHWEKFNGVAVETG